MLKHKAMSLRTAGKEIRILKKLEVRDNELNKNNGISNVA